MLLKYTIDASVDEPIMLLDKHIGFDSEDGQGINGADFARELLYLDSLGKKVIKIQINSVGGSVMDGMSIYNAILTTNAKVDTYNVGICASIAGVIFQAGRNRYMYDYSLFMMHNPHGGNDKNVLKLMKDSLIKMLTRKTTISEEKLSKLMNQTTWLSAIDCLTMGLTDYIEESSNYNKPRISSTNIKDAYKEAYHIVNKLNQNKTSMINVINKLGLNEDSTEEQVLARIEEIENKAKNDLEDAKKQVSEMEDKLSEMKKKVAELEDSKNAMEEEAKLKAEEDCKNKATELVENAIKSGKIVDTEEVKNSWVKLAIENYDNTSTMIEGLTISKVGNKIDVATEGKPYSVVASTMIDLQNKFNN